MYSLNGNAVRAEMQQNLFVASFYCYLNYNDTDFVINLDDIWKWVGFSRKDHCRRMLERNFTKNIDYIIKKAASAAGGALIGENKI